MYAYLWLGAGPDGIHEFDELKEVAAAVAGPDGFLAVATPHFGHELLREVVEVHPLGTLGAGTQPYTVLLAGGAGRLVAAVRALELEVARGVRPVGEHVDPYLDEPAGAHLA